MIDLDWTLLLGIAVGLIISVGALLALEHFDLLDTEDLDNDPDRGHW